MRCTRGTHGDHPRAPQPKAARPVRLCAMPQDVTGVRNVRPGDTVAVARELAEEKAW
jgi:hypothetical protein